MIWKLICWYLSDILFDIYLSWWTIHSLVAKSCPTLCNPMDCRCQAPVSSNISQILMSIELVMLSKHLILWHTLLLLSSIFPNIRVFSTALHMKWPKYFGTLASASVLPTRGWFPLEFSGLISLLFKGLSRVKYSLYHRIQWSHSYIFTQFIENLCPYKILHRALLITTKIYK